MKAIKKILLITAFVHLALLVTAQNGRAVELKFTTDNDFFIWNTSTDRYYSFGLFAGVSYESKKNPRWAIFENKQVISEVTYGLKGFTPSNFETNDNPLAYDRPFAGWHYLGYGKRLNSKNESIFIGSTVGVLGPAAAAGRIQNWFHNLIGDDPVNGWDNQVSNQLGVNFLIEYNKAVWTGHKTEFIVESHSSVGNIFTNSTSRLRMRFGNFSPIGTSMLYGNRVLDNNKSEFFFTVAAGLKVVGYDATLQGGIFNDQRLLPASDLNRGVGVLSYGLFYSKGRFSAGAEVFYTRGEVAKTLNHKYGSISTSFIL